MTNTRITDPEILERRYPVMLHRFSYRPGSGGQGEYVGGDGVIRELEFHQAMTISLLTERRARAPYGMSIANIATLLLLNPTYRMTLTYRHGWR